MRQAERYHRYPRLSTTITAGLSALIVTIAMVNLGAVVLRGLWDVLGRDDALFGRLPLLATLVGWIEGTGRSHATSALALLPGLLLPLAWTAVALLAALVLRNAFPAIRTSNIGLMVEFAGKWLPLRWEDLRMLKVTQDVAGEHFIILAETSPRQLTAWHRLYSLFYNFSRRPGFYISSKISDFDDLLKTMLSQSERTARALEGVLPAHLHEEAQSPIFRLLLSPGAGFSRSAPVATPAPSAPVALPSGPVRAAYPTRISSLLTVAALLIGLALAVSYLGAWSRVLALSLPELRPRWPFNLTMTDPRYLELYNAYRTQGVPFMGVASRPDLPAPWWLLVGAHLRLLVAVPCLLWLSNLLPGLESRQEGLAVRRLFPAGWKLLPWQHIRAFKATELSEQSQVLLLQSPKLPTTARLSSLLYDGSGTPGVLLSSAINNFPALLSATVNSIAPFEQAEQPAILQQEAHSWLFWLALQRGPALDALVAEARSDEQTKTVSAASLLARSAPMVLLALVPALLVLTNGLFGDAPPNLRLLGACLGLWLFGLLEWPLVSLISVLLDDHTGGGEEGYRAVALYPTSQLPRLLPLLGALLLQLVGVPLLPILAWVAAIVWAYWLCSGLCVALYEWKGSQRMLGGLLPVVWQLLLLISFLVITR